MPSNGFSLELPIGKVTKVKHHHGDSIYSVDELGAFKGSFATASNRKELRQLMKSNADVVYDEKSGKLFLNANGTKKGWGKRKLGGLVARFRGKPELSVDNFEGLSAHKADAITGGGGNKDGGKKDGDIKDQIASLREDLSDSRVSELYGETLIDQKKGLKSIARAGKKEGYKFNQSELGRALDEMNDAGAFSDVELDDAALTSLMGMGGSQQDRSGFC